MEKKKLGLSVQDKRVKKSARHIPDHEIDFSDIPELSDEQLKNLKRADPVSIGYVSKSSIPICIDDAVLKKLKKIAVKKDKDFLAFINEILKNYVRKISA